MIPWIGAIHDLCICCGRWKLVYLGSNRYKTDLLFNVGSCFMLFVVLFCMFVGLWPIPFPCCWCHSYWFDGNSSSRMWLGSVVFCLGCHLSLLIYFVYPCFGLVVLFSLLEWVSFGYHDVCPSHNRPCAGVGASASASVSNFKLCSWERLY